MLPNIEAVSQILALQFSEVAYLSASTERWYT